MLRKLTSIFLFICLVITESISQELIQVDTLKDISSELQFERDTLENLWIGNLIEKVQRFVILPREYESSSMGTMDPTRMMQGKNSGLNITANSYTPGASSRITFRGLRSFSNSNQPLILLDGLPIDNSEWNANTFSVDQSNRLIDIDPNFIESIEIERNMAARAKYGIVGANGVISINTKKGSLSKPRITFSSTLSQQQVSNLPQLQNTYAPGRTINGIQTYRGPETFEANSWGPLISSLSFQADPNYPFDQNGQLVQGSSGVAANTYDPYEFFVTPLSNNQSLQVAGGFEKFNYAIVGSLNNQNGVIPSNRYNRNNLGVNLKYQPIEKLEIQFAGSITSSSSLRSQRGSNLSGVTLGLFRTPSTFDNSNGFDVPIDNVLSYQLQDGTQRSHRPGIVDNPYWSLNKNKHTDKVNRQIAQLSAKYKLTEKLDVLITGGVDNYTDSRIGGIDYSGVIKSSSAYERTVNFNAQNLDLSAAYNLIETNEIRLNASLGFNYNQRQTAYDLAEGIDLIIPGNVSITNVENLEILNFLIDNKRAGGVLGFDFSFADFLNVEGVLRQDYSNKFGSKTNGFLSYGLAANFSVLSWANDDNSPFDLIINSSYGKFGNDFLGGSELGIYTEPFISGDGFISGYAESGFELNSTVLDNNFTAEATTGFDLGLNLVSNKYGFSLALLYYNEKSDGLIMSSAIASSSGHSRLLNNAGSVENKGFDISLFASVIDSRKFKWFLDLNFNKNTNLVTALDGDAEEIFLGGFTNTNSIAKVDHPIAAISGNGFFRNSNGDLVIDVNGFPLPGTGEPMVLGDPNPDWTMFINNKFKIGNNFFLSALLDIRQGGEMWCGTCGTLDYFGRSQLSAEERGTSVVFEGVNLAGTTNTALTQLAPFDGTYTEYYRVRYGFGGNTEMNIFDTSWIRLRSVSIGYDFKDLVNLNVVKELKLSLFAENLFLITDYPGIDPETNLTGNSGGLGLDYYNNPGTKTYGINITASF